MPKVAVYTVAGQQLAGVIDLDVDAALAALAHQVGKERTGHAPAGGGAGHDAQFVLAFVRSCRCRQGQQTGAHGHDCPAVETFHETSSSG